MVGNWPFCGVNLDLEVRFAACCDLSVQMICKEAIMSTSSFLRPGASLRRGAIEPSKVLIWEMHASLSPAASI
jgi:hypothetical protein